MTNLHPTFLGTQPPCHAAAVVLGRTNGHVSMSVGSAFLSTQHSQCMQSLALHNPPLPTPHSPLRRRSLDLLQPAKLSTASTACHSLPALQLPRRAAHSVTLTAHGRRSAPLPLTSPAGRRTAAAAALPQRRPFHHPPRTKPSPGQPVRSAPARPQHDACREHE